MTTDSAGVSPPSERAPSAAAGRVPSAGQPTGRVTIASPREIPDRVAVPLRRTGTGQRFRFGLPLAAADALAALMSTAVLEDRRHTALLTVLLIAWVSVLNARAGLYRPAVAQGALDRLPALAARIAVSWCAVAALLAALLPERTMPLMALLTGAASQLVLASMGRSLIQARRRTVARSRRRSTLVVGCGAPAGRLAALLSQHPEYGLRPVGIAAPGRSATPPGRESADRANSRAGGRDPADGPVGVVCTLPVLTTTEEIHRAVIQNGVREAVFVGNPDTGDGVDRAGLVSLFHQYGCATWFVGAGPGYTADAPGHMAEHLWGYACRRVEPPPAGRPGRWAKRLLDIAVTVPVLLAAAPVLAGCALGVRLLDGPGVLFRQERVGQNGRPFVLLKFRTLRPADEHEAATRWSVAGDHRMSTVGHLLRRTSMDELPQLWNVLRGDMSLVGPRPERPYFVANFSKTHPGYAARHRMPVGITGLAQVHGLRGDTSIEERSRFDNHYIDHWSLWQDVCILLRTAASLVRPAGS